MPTPFCLGVNYWPRRKAMYWWSDFDAGEVRDEFAVIRECGLTLVRCFLLWDDFQPEPDRVDSTCLDNLVQVADIAAATGLQLDVTFFTGHMSGPNWAPRWLLQGAPLPQARLLVSAGQPVDSGYRNPYTDPVARSAEQLLVRTVVGTLKDHPALAIWNLGNEPDLFAWPPDDTTGQAWVRALRTLISSLDPQHPVTTGLHMFNLLQNNHLRVDQVFAEMDLAVMHAYPMYMDFVRHPLDPELVPFACALTAALSGKPVLMEEFGGCTAPPGEASYEWNWEGYHRPHKQFMAAEEEFAEYVAQVLPKLVAVGATGAVIWCYADYIPALWDRPPCATHRHERFFGLVRPDGRLKPHAQVLKDFAATHPVVKPAQRQVMLPFSPDEYYRDPQNNLIKLYKDWVEER